MQPTTNIERRRDGLRASTDITLYFAPNRILQIHTSKSSRGGVRCIGSVVKVERGMISFAIFQDFSKTLAEDRNARGTETNILAVHAQALATLDDTMALVRAQYAPKMEEHSKTCAQRFVGAAECDCGMADQAEA